MECLNLIGRLSHRAPSHEALLLLITEFCNDIDPRVRREAMKALLQMMEEGVSIGVSIYNKACELLNDDDESVRYISIKLVHSLGLSLKESTIPHSKDPSVTLSLEDDAFIKTCGMVTDGSLQVRCLSASLLGQFTSVSERFLLQTLDKKLMSHLRYVKSDHDRARELHTQGSWDTGQRWGGGPTKMNLDPSEVTLMSSGSCGAFVHCTEDEFMEVRSAAIQSMGQLSGRSSEFGHASLDFLIDMINDEIQSVRLLALKTLRKVSESINLREDQLETILGVLQESSLEIREAIHDLLSYSHVTSRSGLQSVVQCLLDNLRNYSSDKLSIWSCLKQLGLNHAHLVSVLAPELLSIHPYYMSKEPDINDPAYTSILILVFNGASVINTLTPLFPSHVFRHHLCLRDTLPHLVPPINGF
ncbi:PREDICTED: integrator complex subunit 4-like [Amphimedon queenslandica]|uniref:Integrator complex subunit 4 n=1 Tax=Amphimedon queenslandica TaxID=400682 RepID=A0AAN0JCT9_AMPQE|nr:PREDICTED: integrator complex subunit 4-like [Amphimedon queenslandica]|eukprot:XP_019854799.1 PREDICTED: integrator complex subunit 4-like [Amphimedon queenslandica]